MGEQGFEKEFVDEMCKVWELNDSVIYLPLKLEQTSGLVATIPEGYDRHGLLHVKIVYSTRDHDALVYHEGAHVYLFHLGYPPAQMRRIDFINEYYACKLEPQKRFDDDARKLDELIGDLGTKRIELEVLLGPVGQAIATKLREYWGLGKKPSSYASIFGETYDCLERAPNPPELPGQAMSFTEDEKGEIRQLLGESFPRVYAGEQIQFLEKP
jgi:hypothetical protein